jgi:hypothetical protein
MAPKEISQAAIRPVTYLAKQHLSAPLLDRGRAAAIDAHVCTEKCIARCA